MLTINIGALHLQSQEVEVMNTGKKIKLIRTFRDLPAFTGRNVPIKEIASAIGKDAQYVRLGIQQGLLKFGTAIKVGSSNEFSYYCPDKRVWEETGYFNKEAV